MSTSYLFPTSGTSRAVSLTPWNQGLLYPEWDQPTLWYWNNATLTSVTIPVTGAGGFSSIAVDGSGIAWAPQYYGNIVSFYPGNTFGVWPSFNDVILGVAYVPTYNSLYYLGATGNIYTSFVSGQPLLSQTGGILLSQTGQPLLSQAISGLVVGSFGSAPSWFFPTSGTTLFTLLPEIDAVGTFHLTSASGGVSGFITAPNGIQPTCLTASAPASSIAIGGITNAALPANYTSLAGSVISPVITAISTGSSQIDLYSAISWPLWTLSQSITTTSNPNSVAWNPTGVQFGVSDSTANVISIFNYIFNIASLSQTLTLTGASHLSFISKTSLAAIQPNNITAYGYSLLSGWEFANTISLSGVTSLAPSLPSQAIAGFTSGLAFLATSPIGTTLTISSLSALPFTPQAVGSDQLSLNCAVGSQGGSGWLAIFQGQSLAATFNWPGSGASVAVYRDQILVADPSIPGLRIFGYFINQYRLISVITSVPTGLSQIIITPVTQYYLGSTVFAVGTSGVYEYQFVSPWVVVNLPNGAVANYASGAWTTTTLGTYEQPSAIAYDLSGNLKVSTVQNTLYTISPTGGIITQEALPPYTGQASGVPLGISSMVVSGGALYGSSSLNGALVAFDQNLPSPWIP